MSTLGGVVFSFCAIRATMLQPILHQLNSTRIVLASSSPRRKQILGNIVRFLACVKPKIFSGIHYITIKRIIQLNWCMMQIFENKSCSITKKIFYLKFYIVYLLFDAFCLRKFVILISTTKNSYVTYQLET